MKQQQKQKENKMKTLNKINLNGMINVMKINADKIALGKDLLNKLIYDLRVEFNETEFKIMYKGSYSSNKGDLTVYYTTNTCNEIKSMKESEMAKWLTMLNDVNKAYKENGMKAGELI